MDMRVLVVFEEDYRVYRDVIAVVIRALRSLTEVQTADVDVLEEEVRRFEPHLVICSRPNTLDTGGPSHFLLPWLSRASHGSYLAAEEDVAPLAARPERKADAIKTSSGSAWCSRRRGRSAHSYGGRPTTRPSSNHETLQELESGGRGSAARS